MGGKESGGGGQNGEKNKKGGKGKCQNSSMAGCGQKGKNK